MKGLAQLAIDDDEINQEVPVKRILCGLILAAAASALGQKVLVVPLTAHAVDEADLKTVQAFFYERLQAQHPGTLVAAPDSLAPCDESACAREAAVDAGAQEVVFGSIRKLGRQMFFSASLVEIGTGKSFQQRISVASIEDFEPATRRMAEALIRRESLEQVATIDNITQNEENTPENGRRRTGFYLTGASLGYAWPIDDERYSRWVREDAPGCDDAFGCPQVEREQSYRQIIRLGWNNWLEFKPQLAAELDVLFYAPIAIGADANVLYFFNRSDFSPFAGGGLGMQYVFPDQGSHRDADKRNSGPAINAQAGLVLFRTYDYNLFMRGQYHFVANSDQDNEASIDIGVRTRMGGTGGSKYHRTSATTWIGAALGLAYIIAIIAASSSD